jgi:hypothetical protein
MNETRPNRTNTPLAKRTQRRERLVIVERMPQDTPTSYGA